MDRSCHILVFEKEAHRLSSVQKSLQHVSNNACVVEIFISEETFLQKLNDTSQQPCLVLIGLDSASKSLEDEQKNVLQTIRTQAPLATIVLLADVEMEEAAILLVSAAFADDYVVASAPKRLGLLVKMFQKKVSLSGISEQKLLPMLQHTSQNKLLSGSVFDKADEAILIHDYDGNFLDVNQSACQYLGYERDELLSLSVAEIIVPEFAELIHRRIKIVQQKGWACFESEHLTKDGERIVVELNCCLIEFASKPAILVGVRDIRDRKQAERALHESEQMHRMVSEIAFDYLFKVVIHGNGGFEMVWALGAIERMTGYTIEALNGLPNGWFSILHPEDLAKVDRLTQKILANQPVHHEYRIFYAGTGEIRWQVEHLKPVWDEKAGKVTAFYGAVRDITENKRIEASLQETTLWLKSTFNALDSGVFIATPERKLVDMNRSAERIFGYTRQEMLGLSSEKLHVDRAHYIEFGRRVHHAFKNGDVARFEFEWKRKTGEIFPSEHVITWLVQDDGTPIGILSIIRDISERRWAEMAVRERERQYRLLAENSSDIIALLDKSLGITYISPSIERLTGFSLEEVMQAKISDLVTPESFEKVNRAYRKRIQDLKLRVGNKREVRYEIEHLCKDGSTFWGEDISTFILDHEGQFEGFLVTIRDITDRKAAEASLRKSQSNLSSMIENSKDQIWSVDQNCKLIVANSIFLEKFKAQFGQELKIGESVLPKAIPQALLQKWTSIYTKALRGERFRIQRKQSVLGSQAYIDYLFNPIKNEAGEVMGTTVSGRDVTELIHARQSLEAESSFRHSIITNIAEGLTVSHETDEFPFLEFTLWNDEMCNITGYTREEVNRQGWYQTMYPDLKEREQALARMRRMRNGNDLVHEELEITNARGERRVILMSTSQLHTADGRQHILALMLDISERKQVERALFESQNRYRVATYAGRVGVWDWNFQTGEMFVDPHVKILLGYQEHEIENHIDAWKSILPKEDYDLMSLKIDEHIKERSPHFELAHRIFKKDGSVRWFLKRGNAIRKQGKVIRMVGTDTDITERKHAEESLQHREATLESIFKAAQIGIGFSKGQILIEVNDKLCQILGYEKNEMIGRYARDFYGSREEYKRVGRKIWQQIKKFATSTIEMKARCKDGTIIDLMLSLAPVKTSSHHQGLTFTALDITQRKISEKALRESEARYRTVSELVSDYIYSVLMTSDGKMILEWMTAGFAKITGCSPGENAWREKLLGMVFPADQMLFTRHLQKARAGQKSKIEIRVISRNNEQRWLRDYLKPVFDAETGRLVRLVGAMQDITERKWAEAALKESSKKYRLLAENSSDVIATLDKNLNFTYVSPAIHKLLGFMPDELLHMSPEDIMTTASHRILMREYMLRMEKIRYGEMWLYDFREELELKRKDGKLVAVEYISTPLLDADGQLMGFLTTARNISKRKEAEDALRLSEEKFSKAFRSSPDAMVITRLSDGMYVDVNDAFLELTGYTRDEAIGHTSFKLNSWASTNDYRRLIKLLKSHKFVRNFEMSYGLKSGEKRYGQLSAEIIDIKGEEHIITIARDVTEKKRIEEKIYFQASLLDQVRNTVFVTNLDGEMIYWNQFAQISYQWTSQEVIGRKAIDLLVPKSEQKYAHEVYRQALAKGYWEGEQQLKRKDGSLFPSFCAISVLKDREGNQVGVIRVGSDVSERRELEEQLRQAQKMEAVGRLTGGVAHDFNNLLAAVLGNAEMLERRLASDDKLMKNIQRIKASATRGAELTRKLLTFSRQKKGHARPVEINKCVENVIGLMEHTIDKRVQVFTSLCSEPAIVMGEENQLEMVLLNLAVNASDAMMPVLDKEMEGKLRFETCIETIGEAFAEQYQLDATRSYVRISVSDTGTGISEDIRQKIFEPFFTTKDMESGTGLGLAITYGAVKSHHGAICLESKIGSGTTFRIYLPCYKMGG